MQSIDEDSQAGSSNALVTTTIAFPTLDRVTGESIRTFLRKYDNYDNYVRELAARASQVVGLVSTDAVRPVALKYCVDQDYLESLLCLGFISTASSYDELNDADLRAYLELQAAASKNATTAETHDRLVKKELRIEMRDENAVSRMRNLFVTYHALLRKHGIGCVTNDNPKIAVQHIVAATRLENLRTRLQSDLAFGYRNLKSDFKAFMAHCQELSEAFQLLDVGPASKPTGEQVTSTSSKKTKTESTGSSSITTKRDGQARATREVPVFLYAPHASRGLRHFLCDCKECPEADKKALLDKHFAERMKEGPPANTRSHTQDGNVGRLAEENNATDGRPEFPVLLADGSETLLAMGRSVDGSDDAIISPHMAERAVIADIGKMSHITTVILQVVLKKAEKAENAQTFRFSRKWTCPRIVLHLAAGQLALLNVTFLVADEDLATGDLIIGLPLLQHLRVDSKTLLEENRASLDGTDCSDVKNITAKQHGSRQMGRLSNAIPDDADGTSRFRTNFYRNRANFDEFPDASLLELISEEDPKVDVQQAFEEQVMDAERNGLPADKTEELRKLVSDHMSVFCTTFSSGPPADVPPLKIERMPETRAVRVKLRNYSQEQRGFLKKMMSDLLRCNMVRSNRASSWACAPLLVPKDGPAKFRFTVDLRPVNRATFKHGYLMPNVEQELQSIVGSTLYAKFDLSHGYWQFPLHTDSQECQSFVTPDGVYTPTRVLHGTTNAVTYLQSTIASIFTDDLRRHVLFWLYNILVHHANADGLLHAVRLLIELFNKKNIKLHPAKCILFATSIRWCGRLLSSNGIRFDPRRIEAILHMQLPTTGAHLQQFACALQWMKTAIPEFTSIIDPLHSSLETVYNRAGARTNRAVSKIFLSALRWGKK